MKHIISALLALLMSTLSLQTNAMQGSNTQIGAG